MQFMLDRKIATRRGIMCAHREDTYAQKKEPWRASGSLTESEQSQDQCILLPLFDQLTVEQQETIASELKAALTAEVAA
jgi:dTDP-4-amino-4,6-dideoxygalactose transaminase